jgi:hypothetical protein
MTVITTNMSVILDGTEYGGVTRSISPPGQSYDELERTAMPDDTRRFLQGLQSVEAIEWELYGWAHLVTMANYLNNETQLTLRLKPDRNAAESDDNPVFALVVFVKGVSRKNTASEIGILNVQLRNAFNKAGWPEA